MAEAPAAAPAAGTPPAAAPAAPAPAAGAPPAAPPAAPAPAAAPAAPAANPGDAGFVLPGEVKDWGATKGYTPEFLSTPEGYKIATSYREVEKLIGQLNGGDKLTVPKDTKDFAQVGPVLDRLGAPAKAADYKLEIPQGGDSQFALNASEKFAELKLLPAQAQGLNKWWNEYAANAQKQTLETEANEGRTSITKLETEWGADTNHNSEIAARGFSKLATDIGMDAARIEAIKNGNSVKLSAYEFAKLTKAYGDMAKVAPGDKFEGDNLNNGGGGTAHTPESAKAEINRLRADPAFAARLFAKDAEAKKQMDDLYKIAGAGGVTSLT